MKTLISNSEIKDNTLADIIDVNRFSNFSELVRVTAWVKRLLHNLN